MPGLRDLLLVTDPGPDPDDVKAILTAVVLTKQGELRLRGVICNGGGQPIRRARLARCILDRLHVPDIPVGIGSPGTRSVEQPHEMMLLGYDNVADARLYDGHALFLRVLRSARPKSLVVCLISSLRDFADVLAAEPQLVRRAVVEVIVQGGLEKDPAATFGWRPDASQNNVFDADAANVAYDFCFAHKLPMSVVSRDAVPLLPMQLAKSFATRTGSPLLLYLANSQALGLIGLWRKVCAGELPPRCSKQWYFKTFCGVDEDAFEARGLNELDKSADIGHHLKGFVKPYDVCALMMAVSTTMRSSGLQLTIDGVTHNLLLSAEHKFDVWTVHNVLRDVFHVVAALDPAVSLSSDGGDSFGSSGPAAIIGRPFRSTEENQQPPRRSVASDGAHSVPGGRSKRLPNPYLLNLTSQLRVSVSQSSAEHRKMGRWSGLRLDTGAARGSGDVSTSSATTLWPPPQMGPGVSAAGDAAANSVVRSRCSSEARSSGRVQAGATTDALFLTTDVEEVRELALAREASEAGVLSAEQVGGVLTLALQLAQKRQRRLELVTLAVGGLLCTVGLGALLSLGLRTQLEHDTVRAIIDAFWLGRLALASFCFVVGGTVALLSLQPVPAQRKRIHVITFVFNVYVGIASLFYLYALVVAVADIKWRDARRRDPIQTASAIGVGYTVVVGLVLMLATFGEHRLYRHDTAHVLWLTHRILAVCFSGQCFAELALMVALSMDGFFFAQPNGAALAALAYLPVAIYVAGTVLTWIPELRETLRWLVMLRLGAPGALEALAPLLRGSERKVCEICTDGLERLEPVLLDQAALRLLEALWTHSANTSQQRLSASEGWRNIVAADSRSAHGSRHDVPPAGTAAEMAQLQRSTARIADAYLVHAWEDTPLDKIRVLRAWAATFEREHGRLPAVWVDALCAQPRRAQQPPGRPRRQGPHVAQSAPIVPAEQLPSRELDAPTSASARTTDEACAAHAAANGQPSPAGKAQVRFPLGRRAKHARVGSEEAEPARDDEGPDESEERQLQELVLRICRSSSMLLLAGPGLFERLWCVIECFCWFVTGGSAARVRLLPISNQATDDAELLAAADCFHVLFCDAALDVHKRRLSLVTKVATVVRMNSVMRALLDPLHGALDSISRWRMMGGEMQMPAVIY